MDWTTLYQLANQAAEDQYRQDNSSNFAKTKWLQLAAQDPQAAFNQDMEQRDQLRNQWGGSVDKMKDAVNSAQVNKDYNTYMAGRGGRPPGLTDNTRWVNDAGRWDAKNGGYAPATQGLAWDEYRNSTSQPRTIGRGTEFEQRIPGFRQLARQQGEGGYSRSPGNWRIAENSRNMFGDSMNQEPEDFQTPRAGRTIPEMWADFDPAKYTLYEKNIPETLSDILQSQGANVNIPNMPWQLGAALGPTGLALQQALSHPLDPRLVALTALGTKWGMRGVKPSAVAPEFNTRGVMVGEGAGPFSPQRPVPPRLLLESGQDFTMQPGIRPTPNALPPGINDRPLQLPYGGMDFTMQPGIRPPVGGLPRGSEQPLQLPEYIPDWIPGARPPWQTPSGNLPSTTVFPERLRRALINARMGYGFNPWEMP